MPITSPRFFCINSSYSVPTRTTDALSAACAARDVEYLEIDAAEFDYTPERQAQAGDLIYTPSVNTAAYHVEQFIMHPQAATFYAHPWRTYFQPLDLIILFARANVPIPRSFYVGSADRDLLRGMVERLGGFPTVLKVLGYSGGLGVMQVDSFKSLFSLVDYILSQGTNPQLMEFVEHTQSWRVFIIGDQPVAAYLNDTAEGDFRSEAPEHEGAYRATPPDAVVQAAVQAVKSLELEFGGVDVLVRPDGSPVVLESNFPTYFGHAQYEGGIDVAGAMLDYLLAKRTRLLAQP